MKSLLTILFYILIHSITIGQSTYTITTQVKHNDTLFLKNVTYTYHFDSTLKYVATQHWQDSIGIPPIIYDTAWYYQRYRVIDSEVSDSTQVNKPTLSSLGLTDVGRGLAALTNPNAFSLIRINSDNTAVTRTLSEARTDLQVSNVDNTSDANKPVSTAQQTALNLKANLASPTFTGIIGGITASMVGLGSVTNESKATMFTNAAFTGTFDVANGSIANADLANSAVANLSGTNTGDNANNTQYANDFRTANFVAGTNYLAPNGSAASLTSFPTLNQNTTGSAATLTTPRSIYGNNFDGSAALGQIIASGFGGTGNGFTKFSGPASSEKTFTLPNANATITSRVATAQIAATASATSTTTLFTPPADGFYRVTVYLKITTTGTSPVAGPVTITYTDGLGSVAQSHVMQLKSVTGTVVTTTVNNSTTTGTVSGSLEFFAKASVAIQYAIAVSGTFGAGRYQAFITCEAL